MERGLMRCSRGCRRSIALFVAELHQRFFKILPRQFRNDDRQNESQDCRNRPAIAMIFQRGENHSENDGVN